MELDQCKEGWVLSGSQRSMDGWMILGVEKDRQHWDKKRDWWEHECNEYVLSNVFSFDFFSFS